MFLFRVILKRSNPLLQLLKGCQNILESVNLFCCEDGLHIESMDKSQICLLKLFMPKDSFKRYDYKKNNTIGINLKAINKALKFANKEEDMICIMQQSTDVLKVNIWNAKS